MSVISGLDYMTTSCTSPCCQKPKPEPQSDRVSIQTKANPITQTGLPQHSLHIPKCRRVCLPRQMKLSKRSGLPPVLLGLVRLGQSPPLPALPAALHTSAAPTPGLSTSSSRLHMPSRVLGASQLPQRGLWRVTCLLSRISSRSRAVSGVSALAKHSGLVSAAAAMLGKALQLMHEAH